MVHYKSFVNRIICACYACFIAYSLCSSATIYEFPQVELQALNDLYYSCSGEYWNWRMKDTPWNVGNSSANPCVEGWTGVSCNAECTNIALRGSNDTTTVQCYTTNIQLPTYNLTGTLPSSIGNFSQLTVISLESNNIKGSIPPTFGRLTKLSDIDFTSNELHGKIPKELYNLHFLVFLDLGKNLLSGSIPDIWMNMSELLLRVDLSNNRLNGSVPPGIGGIANAISVILHNNELTGPIPVSVENFTQIIELDLSNNYLSQQIPDQLMNVKSLQTLLLGNNLFDGTVPSNLGNLEVVRLLEFTDNLLTGTIPPSIQGCKLLRDFAVNSNQLTGTVPNELGKCINLEQLQLNQNYLEGSFPSTTFEQLQKLQSVILSQNNFIGTFSSHSLGWPSLSTMAFSENYFSGALLSVTSPALMIYNASKNMFGGPIGSIATNYELLSYVDVSFNQLTGTLAHKFEKFYHLVQLLLNDNMLSGPIDNLVNSNMTILLQMSLDNNGLTGTIPSEIFKLPRIEQVVLGVNCFTGTLPEEICNAKNLESLVLDGLHTAKTCRQQIFYERYTYAVYNPVRGTIPHCLFNMSSLQLLHLSGNGLTGKLEGLQEMSSTLEDVSLSHNKLSGSIPDCLLNSPTLKLDLSFNIFGGTLPSNMSGHTDNYTLSLQDNRLSGKLPFALFDMTDLNVLEGNMFECNGLEYDLPRNDPDFYAYACASDPTNNSLIVWGAFLFLALIGVVILYCFKSFMMEQIFIATMQVEELMKDESKDSKYLRTFCYTLQKIQRFTMLIGTIVLVIAMPLYAALKLRYGTFEKQYAWTVALCYLSGVVPAVLCFLFLMALLRVAMSAAHYFIDPTLQQSEDESSVSNSMQKQWTWKEMLFLVIFGIIAIILVVLVNVAYVYLVVVNGLSIAAISLLSLCLAVFKLLWGQVLTITYLSLSVTLNLDESGHLEKAAPYFLMGLAIFNNIIAPYLAEAFISPTCFYYVLFSAADVTSSFGIIQCSFEQIPPLCDLTPNGRSFTYNPPFQYSYQCSSALLTAFVYVFVYRYLISGIILPLLHIALKYLRNHFYAKYGKKSMIVRLLTALLPPLLRPVMEEVEQEEAFIRNSSFGKDHFELPIRDSATSENDLSNPLLDQALVGNRIRASSNSMLAIPFRKGAFGIGMQVKLLGDLAVMMSFGVLFPPLTFVIAVSMCLEMYFMQGCLVRLIQHSKNTNTSLVLHAISQDIKQLPYTLPSAVRWVFVAAALFWSYALYDTLGDSVGAAEASWIIVVTALAPWWLNLIEYLRKKSCK